MSANDVTLSSAELHSQGLQLINGAIVSQGLHVAATLQLADQLANKPLTVTELAEAVGADPTSLYRVLRLLCGYGFFYEDEEHRFAVTSLGEKLRTDGSLYHWALFVGEPQIWNSYGNMLHAVKTGKSAFEDVEDTPFFSFVSNHPEIGPMFNQMMVRQSGEHDTALAESHDFTRYQRIADIGGGNGATLAAILTKTPDVRGVLFDFPKVVADVAPLRDSGVLDRCEVVGGDMYETIPADCDCYIIKRLISGLTDEQATSVLVNCVQAMAPDGRVLVVDPVLGERNTPGVNNVLDVVFLNFFGQGRMRTEDDFRKLFAVAGLELVAVWPTGSPNVIVEGRRAVAS